MEIVRCLHTAILVSDLSRAQAFYETTLGLTPVDRLLKFPGIWYQIGDYQLHLLVHSYPPTELRNPDKWGRNPHIAIAVSDLEAAKTRLQVAGCPLQMSSSGRAALFTQDPDGNIIEISQA